jgi:hypothetical protein
MPGTNLERFRTIQHENLERLNDDIAILTKYLQSQKVPKAALNAPRSP